SRPLAVESRCVYTRRFRATWIRAQLFSSFEDVDAGAPFWPDGLHDTNVRLKLRTFERRDTKSRLAPRRESMTLNLRRIACHCILAVGVAAALGAAAAAQVNIRSVTFYTVQARPGRRFSG